MDTLKRLATRGLPKPSLSTVPESDGKPTSMTTSSVAPPSSPEASHMFTCTVRMLDEAIKPLEMKVQRDANGQWLFDRICEELGGLVEGHYFGLKFIDKHQQKQWLELGRNVFKQLKHTSPYVVSFRVKHYPSDPIRDVKQEVSRYYLYLQLKRDLLHGRLLGSMEDQCLLAAHVVQAELGDYDEIEAADKDGDQANTNYMSDFKVLYQQTAKMEARIAEIHRTLCGLDSSEAERGFVTRAAAMDTYGVDPIPVTNPKTGAACRLGLTHGGLVTYQGSNKESSYSWGDIQKFACDSKLFEIYLQPNSETREQTVPKKVKKLMVSYKCETKAAALALWKLAVDRRCFFTLNQASEAKRTKASGNVFRRKDTFRFSGMCQKEIKEKVESEQLLAQPDFTRVASMRRLPRGDSLEMSTGYATFPRRGKSVSPGENGQAPKRLPISAEFTSVPSALLESEPIIVAVEPELSPCQNDASLHDQPRELPVVVVSSPPEDEQPPTGESQDEEGGSASSVSMDANLTSQDPPYEIQIFVTNSESIQEAVLLREDAQDVESNSERVSDVSEDVEPVVEEVSSVSPPEEQEHVEEEEEEEKDVEDVVIELTTPASDPGTNIDEQSSASEVEEEMEREVMPDVQAQPDDDKHKEEGSASEMLSTAIDAFDTVLADHEPQQHVSTAAANGTTPIESPDDQGKEDPKMADYKSKTASPVKVVTRGSSSPVLRATKMAVVGLLVTGFFTLVAAIFVCELQLGGPSHTNAIPLLNHPWLERLTLHVYKPLRDSLISNLIR